MAVKFLTILIISTFMFAPMLTQAQRKDNPKPSKEGEVESHKLLNPLDEDEHADSFNLNKNGKQIEHPMEFDSKINKMDENSYMFNHGIELKINTPQDFRMPRLAEKEKVHVSYSPKKFQDNVYHNIKIKKKGDIIYEKIELGDTNPIDSECEGFDIRQYAYSGESVKSRNEFVFNLKTEIIAGDVTIDLKPGKTYNFTSTEGERLQAKLISSKFTGEQYHQQGVVQAPYYLKLLIRKNE
ncbi:hypothetical protein [Aureibacter tunicatorum]|uniref:Uncharacterized protein n=1 Tax=Aureibacter tunicatorum TaxID=866807 RepID=A0AAE3XRV4_9BACT|nr:hypothetical protein [Aureibacter tunicatorum]MDR6241477.1 hypothetical protein [Aureibacter tunicatorum]BDD06680.1 hypothetical protein AUTU_41630 [Aureibacter tunicatorum]